MTYKELAQLIPADYRREILEMNMISKATAIKSDASMLYLLTIWSNYIDSDVDEGCELCLERVLGDFRKLQPALAELEKEEQLLNAL